jgi:hypothetical protein
LRHHPIFDSGTSEVFAVSQRYLDQLSDSHVFLRLPIGTHTRAEGCLLDWMSQFPIMRASRTLGDDFQKLKQKSQPQET